MVDLKVNLSGITLDNPVIPASGTFGYGKEFAEIYDINILGSISFKGTTREARLGNPLPRIAECTDGMINSVGLQNPGLDAVCEKELPDLAKIYKKPVIANISGFSIDEYTACASAMDKQEQVGIIEVNVSCPNVHNGGMAYGVLPESAAEVTRAVKAVTSKPVYIKLSPNVTDIVEIAKACEEAGADGLSLINTLLGMRIDIRPAQTGHCQQNGRLLRSCDFSGSSPYGISGGKCRKYSGDRYGRRKLSPRCDRNDDGRRLPPYRSARQIWLIRMPAKKSLKIFRNFVRNWVLKNYPKLLV